MIFLIFIHSVKYIVSLNINYKFINKKKKELKLIAPNVIHFFKKVYVLKYTVLVFLFIWQLIEI